MARKTRTPDESNTSNAEPAVPAGSEAGAEAGGDAAPSLIQSTRHYFGLGQDEKVSCTTCGNPVASGETCVVDGTVAPS